MPAALQGRRVIVSLEFDSVKVFGGHHEGRLRVCQPGKYGLPNAQRGILYDDVAQTVALSFTAELRRQGVEAFWGSAPVNISSGALLVYGRVEKIVLNTYGGRAPHCSEVSHNFRGNQ